jgi:hypothetical protein
MSPWSLEDGLKPRGVAWLVTVLILLNTLASLPARADIATSKHDFSSAGWNGTGEVCVTCHTPHNAAALGTAAPLWNHELTTATYTLYSSATLSATPEQPRAASKLCLSCHDGTIGLDSFGGMTGTQAISGSGLIDPDLRDTHPISIQFTHKDINNCSTCHPFVWDPDLGAWITVNNPYLPFPDGRVECTSCHDPHASAPLNPSGVFMLRKPDVGSESCFHFHHR